MRRGRAVLRENSSMDKLLAGQLSEHLLPTSFACGRIMTYFFQLTPNMRKLQV